MKKSTSLRNVRSMEVFILRNKINGKEFVGRTTYSTNKRTSNATKYNAQLNYDLHMLGQEAFEREVVCVVNNEKELTLKANALIKERNTLQPNGYNTRIHGEVTLKNEQIKTVKAELDDKRNAWRVYFVFKRKEHTVGFFYDKAEALAIVDEISKHKKAYKFIPKEVTEIIKKHKNSAIALNLKTQGSSKLSEIN